MKKPRNTVGPQIRSRRIAAGLSQAELAGRCNILGWDISRETLAKIESQVRWVADFELIHLSRALGTDPNTLLQFSLEE